MKRKTKISIIILVVFLIVIGSSFLIYNKTKEKPIGGQRDEHGCLGPAGYTWNENIKACVREWELDMENKREAAKIAVEDIGKEKGLTITEVLVARCPGCFVISLNKYNEEFFEVNLESWEVKTLSPEECIAKGGRTLNIVGGDVCNKDETNIGKVIGFISPNVCCLAR